MFTQYLERYVVTCMCSHTVTSNSNEFTCPNCKRACVIEWREKPTKKTMAKEQAK